MGVIDGNLVNMPNDIKNAQQIKDLVLKKLTEEGIITTTQRDEYTKDYQILIIKKSWWSNWKTIFNTNNEDGWYYRLVKIN